MSTRYSLLENVLRLSSPQRQEVSLPQALSLLGSGQRVEFAGLQAYQQYAWHAFLVQLAALAAHRSGWTDLASDEGRWQEALLGLSQHAGEDAWCLVNSELSRPAFMQPPVPEGTLERFKGGMRTPDALDVLVTAKNHDVKTARIPHPQPDHWVYALVTLQTMEGFLGRGNYGIVRMNGGFASRPSLSFAGGLDWSERFHRDVETWLEHRDELVDAFQYPDSGGVGLLWLLPWDGQAQVHLRACDPFFIEICRRIRLRESGLGLEAFSRPSDGTRVAVHKEHKGATGDIWAPVDGREAVLAVTRSGFTYRLLHRVLFEGEFSRNAALQVRERDSDEPLLIAQVLARGQGQTAGYHERVIPLTNRAKRFLSRLETREQLAERAKAWVQRAQLAERKVLHPCVCLLLQGGEDKLDLTDKRTQRWVDRLDSAIDQVFFRDLWGSLESDEPSEPAWERRLVDLAEAELQNAMQACPTPLARSPRAQARAEILFRRSARKHLPGAFKKPDSKEDQT